MPKPRPTDEATILPGMPLRSVRVFRAAVARGQANAEKVEVHRQALGSGPAAEEPAFNAWFQPVYDSVEDRP